MRIRREDIAEICQECGAKCCKGPSPNITIFDMIRILKYINERPENFSKYFEVYTHEEYLRSIMPKLYGIEISMKTINALRQRLGIYFEKVLLIKLKKVNRNCIFLRGCRCEIYNVRPMACRAYPLKISGIDYDCPLTKYEYDFELERKYLGVYMDELCNHYKIMMENEVFSIDTLVKILRKHWDKVSIL